VDENPTNSNEMFGKIKITAKMHNFNLTPEFIKDNTINSNRVYGQAIFDRGAVEIINFEGARIEAWDQAIIIIKELSEK
jgi:hypothetical protein